MAFIFRPEDNGGIPLEEQPAVDGHKVNLECEECGHSWSIGYKYLRYKSYNSDCPKKHTHNNRLVDHFPGIATWLCDGSDATKIVGYELIDFKCPDCGTIFRLRISYALPILVEGGSPCSDCYPRHRSKSGKLLFANYPHLREMTDAEETLAQSDTPILWNMPCGHSYSESPRRMLWHGDGDCRICLDEAKELWQKGIKTYLDAHGGQLRRGVATLPCVACGVSFSKKQHLVALMMREDQVPRCSSCKKNRQSMVEQGDPSLLDRISDWKNVIYSEENELPADRVYPASARRILWECASGSHTWETFAYAAKDACPSCAGSSGEEALFNAIGGNDLNGIRRDRTIIHPYELDLYFPDLGIAIEHNGTYWHSGNRKDSDYHRMKFDRCEAAGVRMITVWEDDFRKCPEQVVQFLRSELGKDQVVEVESSALIDQHDASVFHNKNSICGSAWSTYHIGMFSRGEMVGVLSVKDSQGVMMVDRYSTTADIVGGVDSALECLPGGEVFAVVDLSLGAGAHAFEEAGFFPVAQIPPEYTYVINHERVSRFDVETSTYFASRIDELDRAWDCGKILLKKVLT